MATRPVRLKTDDGGLLEYVGGPDGWLRIEPVFDLNSRLGTVDSVSFRQDRHKELRTFLERVLKRLKMPKKAKRRKRAK